MTGEGGYEGPERRQSERERKQRILLAGLLLLMCFVLAVFSVVNALDAGDEADGATELANAIQDSRYAFYLAECEDINMRNEATIDALNGLIEQEVAKHPEREARIRSDVEGTILLIDAILPPTKDCAKKAAKAVELKSEE
jgi:hypothetical protein